jgi:polyisoprenoid-binding protein YceI
MALQIQIPTLTGTWRVDRSRSNVDFLIRHLGVATVRGTFTSFDGSIADHGPQIAIAGRVDVGSVDTGDEIRDRRLRDEFFEAERFPVISFEAVTATPVMTANWRLDDARLTIRDTTRPFALAITPEILDDATVRLRLDGRLTRSEFGLEWGALRKAGRLLVADHLRVVADIVIERS